jgi:hypothetical protein
MRHDFNEQIASGGFRKEEIREAILKLWPSLPEIYRTKMMEDT